MKNLMFSLIAIIAAIVFFLVADYYKSLCALFACFACAYAFVYFMNKD